MARVVLGAVVSLVIWHYDNDNDYDGSMAVCILFVCINCTLTGVWYKAKNSLFHRYKIPTSPSVILFLVSSDSLWTMLYAVVSYMLTVNIAL